jgi:hypothetical protein
MRSQLNIVQLCLLLLTPLAAAAPSQEFWDYMAEFSDEKGDVLDPLELDEITATKDQEGEELDKNLLSETQKVTQQSKQPELNTHKSAAPTVLKKGANL